MKGRMGVVSRSKVQKMFHIFEKGRGDEKGVDSWRNEEREREKMGG